MWRTVRIKGLLVLGGPQYVPALAEGINMKVFLVFLGALALASAMPNGRIIGGQEASEGQFPYMVSLRTTLNAHYCGGWIYNTRYVISAAHCTIGRSNANTISVVGATRLNEGGTRHVAVRVTNHPNYNVNTQANDISVIWTATEIIITPNVAPIAVSTADIGGGVVTVVSGWGWSSAAGDQSNTLQWMQTSTLTNDECRAAHPEGNRSRITDLVICTANVPGMGACTGDDGSPLTAGNNAIGLYSWSATCASGIPDVYTRIASYVPWIRGIAG